MSLVCPVSPVVLVSLVSFGRPEVTKRVVKTDVWRMWLPTSPPHRNPIFTSKMIKNIEKMTVPFTDAAYLQQVVALEGRLCHITAFLQSDGRSFLPHFYGGSETRRFHCKTQQFAMICMPLMGFFFKIIVKRDVFRACKSNGKTGMF